MPGDYEHEPSHLANTVHHDTRVDIRGSNLARLFMVGQPFNAFYCVPRPSPLDTSSTLSNVTTKNTFRRCQMCPGDKMSDSDTSRPSVCHKGKHIKKSMLSYFQCQPHPLGPGHYAQRGADTGQLTWYVSSEIIQIQNYKRVFGFQNVCEETENSWLSGAGISSLVGS